MTRELKDHAAKYGVTLLPYGQVVSFLKERTEKETVLFDVANTSYALSCALQEKGETVDGKESHRADEGHQERGGAFPHGRGLPEGQRRRM